MTIGTTSGGHFFDTSLSADGVLYADGSGVITSTVVGTVGQVLTSNGAGSPPTFQTSSGGAKAAFLAYLSTAQPDATGNGTNFQVPFDAVAFDVTSNFTTGASALFTAPVTGKYFLSASVNCYLNVNSASDTVVSIIATSRSIKGEFYVGPAFSSSLTTVPVCALIDMTAGDTAYVNVNISGTGSDTCQINGSGSPYETYFSGYLVE